MRPLAPAQPHRPAPVYFTLPQAAPPWGARRVPSESLGEDKLSDFPESEASSIAKQARSKLLDRVGNFCELERGDTEEQKQVMGMKCPPPLYHDPARATINLALPWHSIAEEIADLNFKIVYGQLNKCMKSCHLAKPWASRDFTSIGYHTHNLEGYVPSTESLIIPSKPPPTDEPRRTSAFV